MNIYQKMLEVMKGVSYLSKDDKVEFKNTKYKAISEEKVTSTVREKLIEQGLVIFPVAQAHRREGILSIVDVTYRIVNTENPDEHIDVVSSGSGADTQDKGVGNRMLRDYGQYERVEGQLIAVPLPDTDQTEREILNKMEYHLALSPKITIMKGQTKRIYLLLRGSSTYNTEEMARLISGLIDECRWSGIPDSEIMTPFEKQKLYEQYGIGEKHEQ